jgi:hypothetical protein
MVLNTSKTKFMIFRPVGNISVSWIVRWYTFLRVLKLARRSDPLLVTLLEIVHNNGEEKVVSY